MQTLLRRHTGWFGYCEEWQLLVQLLPAQGKALLVVRLDLLADSTGVQLALVWSSVAIRWGQMRKPIVAWASALPAACRQRSHAPPSEVAKISRVGERATSVRFCGVHFGRSSTVKDLVQRETTEGAVNVGIPRRGLFIRETTI